MLSAITTFEWKNCISVHKIVNFASFLSIDIDRNIAEITSLVTYVLRLIKSLKFRSFQRLHPLDPHHGFALDLDTLRASEQLPDPLPQIVLCPLLNFNSCIH
jgi:hypothetical protein